mmetsp:Transcript_30627/g.47001  ORF Transcript_30627/g.47001 Transcript_30627/m.47001 type:complete len:242 (-) Transcript_30627:3869-4594(-)
MRFAHFRSAVRPLAEESNLVGHFIRILPALGQGARLLRQDVLLHSPELGGRGLHHQGWQRRFLGLMLRSLQGLEVFLLLGQELRLLFDRFGFRIGSQESGVPVTVVNLKLGGRVNFGELGVALLGVLAELGVDLVSFSVFQLVVSVVLGVLKKAGVEHLLLFLVEHLLQVGAVEHVLFNAVLDLDHLLRGHVAVSENLLLLVVAQDALGRVKAVPHQIALVLLLLCLGGSQLLGEGASLCR